MESLCESLWKSLPARDEDAKNVIHRIAQFFQRELTSEERDVALHVLFFEERGLCSFVSRCITNKFFHKIVSEIFLLLSYLLVYYRSALDPHVLKIKDTCTMWIKNPTVSDSKDKALDALIAITRSQTWSANLDVPSLLLLLIAKTPAKSKIESPTVLRKVYILIGIIAQNFPAESAAHEKRILRVFLKELRHQTLTASKVEFNVIEGCFDGLVGFLYSFQPNANSDQDVCQELIEILKKVLCNRGSSKHTAHKAALRVLSRHGEQLGSFLFKDYREWHNILSLWLSQNKEERREAKLAILTFYKVTSSYISASNSDKDVLNFFIDHFKKTFASAKDMDVAVKGFGMFSRPCKVQMPDEIPAIFNLLAQRAEEACEETNQHKLVDYLESLAALSTQLGVIHNLQLSILEGLSVHLITLYPREDNPEWQTAILNSIIVTMMFLSRCSGMILDMYLSTTVYQGLLRTVSHPVLQDVDLLKETGQKVVTYKNYLGLWHGLISLNVCWTYTPLTRGPLNEKPEMSALLFNKIIYSVVEIIHKLDLNVKENTEFDTVSLNDVEKCFEAVHPQDFTVLVNLVDFVIEFFNGLPDTSYLNKWISPLILDVIKLSTKYPLVSSFYKLLANIVKVASRMGYFEQEDMVYVEWSTCMNLLSGFLLDIIIRHSQYKGDLQVACLHLILATPSNIASTLFPPVTSACETVFRVGSSMLSLAQEGLKTLIRWNQNVPKEKMKLLLEGVLPMFDRILQTKDVINLFEDGDEAGQDGMETVKKVAFLQKKQKKSMKHNVKSHSDTELGQLQADIVLFLSSLDTDVGALILDKSEERSLLMSWQRDKFLEFPLPYFDMKIPVQFDELLPRISDLALNCSDRQTRSSACELLHAIIMFMLGKEKQLELARQGQLTDLWKHLFPVIFRLACDADILVSQLYKPLGEQLAHWYSSKLHLGSQQASAFLEALLHDITHDTDAALRDYSSICLHEYVAWARKQGQVFEKVAPLLKKIVSLCQHPSSHKRLGAALAFNGMYKILREDRNIVDDFWLELLHSFSTALSMCALTGEESQTEKQIEKSLLHILRVLKECSSLFNTDKNRRIPKDFRGSTLWHGVRWLLDQCSSLTVSCRRNAMTLIKSLAPHIPNCRSLSDIFQKIKTEEGPEALSQIVEGTHNVSLQLSDKNLSWDKAMKWVHSVLAKMEICLWLMDNDISPTTLINLEKSLVFKNIFNFLNNVVGSPVHEFSLWRPKAIADFNTSKCTCIVRLIEFLTSLLKMKLESSLISFWNEKMWDIVTYCTLWPSHIGFDTSSKSVFENLPCVMEDFLQALKQNSKEEIFLSLREYMRNHALQTTPHLLRKFPLCIRDDKVEQRLRDLVEGLKTFHQTFKDTEEWSGLTSDSIYNTVFSSIAKENVKNKSPVSLGPSAAGYAESLLSLSFCLSFEVKTLMGLTMDCTPLYRSALQGELSHGEHFVICFKSILTQKMIQQPVKCIESIVNRLHEHILPQNLSILPALLGDDIGMKTNARNNVTKLVSSFLSSWCSFSEWAKNDNSKEMWLISILSYIVRYDLPFMPSSSLELVFSWIVERLCNTNHSLSFKTRLIALLPLLSKHENYSQLKNALSNLKDQHFPIFSEFSKGSEEYNQLFRACEELLKSAKVSGSPVILETIVKIMTADKHYPCSDILPAGLEAFMIGLRNEPSQQVVVLNMVYSLFAVDGRKCDVRLRILNNFLLPLLKHTSGIAQNKFAEEIIYKLVTVVTSSVSSRNDGELKRKQTLVSHIGCWNILQHIFGFSSPSRLEEKGSELVKAAFGGDSSKIEHGSDLAKLLTRKANEGLACNNTASEENWGDEFKEIRRLYVCAVYNMLATLLCNLRTSPANLKLFEGVLFAEKSATNRYIWRNIVDSRKTYIQPFVLSKNLKTRKQLVTIRRQLQEERKVATSVSQSLELLGTQPAAFAGTLEADITRFDFTHSVVLSAPLSNAVAMDVEDIVLESDDLNNHECMAMLCAIIRHMVDSNMTPVPEVMEGCHPMPPLWMRSLQSSMLDTTCHRNACIFLLRLILNCETYFSPYCFHWMDPVIQITAKHCLQSPISYLLGDLVYAIVKWSAIASPSEIHRAPMSAILHFLVENCYNTEREVLRFHLELIRSIVTVWKQFVDPPFVLLANFLSHSDQRVGIHLMAIMLFNDIAPWTHNKGDIFKFLIKTLQEKRKEVYKASAETVGLCLKYFNKHFNEDWCEVDKKFLESILNYANVVHLKENDVERFLVILYAIHDKVPTKLDSFIPVLLYYLVQTVGDTKALCLSLLASRLECLGKDAFKEMKDKDVSAMLLDRNMKVQIQALQVLRKLAPSLSPEELLEVTNMISIVPQLENKDAREIAYEIAFTSFDHLSLKKEKEMLSNCEQDIYIGSKAILLCGLADKNLKLQKINFALWAKEGRLPRKAQERLLALLNCLYSSHTEEHFVAYGVDLMMEATKNTPDYDSAVFQHGLEDCSYSNYQIVSSWRAKHASMAPMFAQTFSSQINSQESLNSSFGDSSLHILATQNSFVFQPTLSSSADDTSSEESIMKSSLMFSSSQTSMAKDSPRAYKQGADFGLRRMRINQSADVVDGPESSSPPFQYRRFMGKNKAGDIFSLANIRRMKKREELRQERVRRREGQVELFRRYRKGDFPDIQVKPSDFITPLTEIAKRDSFVARKVLVSLFIGVKLKLSPQEVIQFVVDISSAMHTILKSSRCYEASLVGALLEIAFEYKLQLDPCMVADVSKKSGLLSLGALVLESNIEQTKDRTASKRIWLSLADLYNELGERDVAHAILLSHVEVGQVAKAALHAHAEENWLSARKLYFQAVVATKDDHFYESLFECMVRLSEWKDVKRIVREQVDNNIDKLWEESWQEEKLLPRLIHSEILSIIQENPDESNFVETIKRWSNDEEKAPILKDLFCESLSVLHLLLKNVPHARFYAKKSMSKFIDDWSALNVLSVKQRELALISVHPVAEILIFLDELNSSHSDDVRSLYLKKLEAVMPAAHDSLSAWETRISYRTVFFNHLPDSMREETNKAFVRMHLCLVESALQQNNMIFAKKYIDMLKDKAYSCEGSIKARWIIAKCQERHLWAKSDKHRDAKPVERLSNLLRVWRILDDVLGTQDLDLNPKLSILAHSTESSICCSVKLLLKEATASWDDVMKLDQNSANWLSAKLQLKSSCSNDLMQELENLGLRSLIHSKNMTKSCHRESDSYSNQVADAYLCIAQYCRNSLECSSLEPNLAKSFSKHFVQDILSAMMYGSSVARQLFPLVLQLPNLSTELAEDFQFRSNNVPEWMFLNWIPQLLAVLDSNLSAVVMPLLLRLAEKFPNAIIYPYNISREKYMSDDLSNQPISHSLKKLDSILETNFIQMQFIRHMSCLCHPSVVLKHYLKECVDILKKKETDWRTLLKTCEEIYLHILQEDPTSGAKKGDVGRLYKTVSRDSFKDSFAKLYGAVCKKDRKLAARSCQSLIALNNDVEERDQSLPNILKVKDLSPWLSEFSASKFFIDIEIPGQYHGDCRPSPEKHVFISSFVSDVQVMPSIRRPVKLTIIGSDAQHHDFLLKFGEDLRQDERVQQLFRLMNGVFQKNAYCWNRRLSLATYRVMPLSNRLGLIEWVGHTTSMKDLMLTALSEHEKILWSETLKQHKSWFCMREKYSRADSCNDYQKLVSSVPLDILRRGFVQRSSSAEAFYSLRHKFITSYSTMCIAHWVIGVGDRHLSNCLMSLKSGQCVGIDFGHTFGTATQFLAVPELVPFRLTPHIVGLMTPFNEIGLIEETMVHSVRALRSDSELLLATMQIFILEPSLDWLQFTQKAILEGQIGFENCAWLPVVKINQAKRKLEGINPVVIILEDLTSGHKEKESFGILCDTLKGDLQTSIRSKLEDEDLSPRQQVESLIDLATDAEVLFKTYFGWEPWA